MKQKKTILALLLVLLILCLPACGAATDSAAFDTGDANTSAFLSGATQDAIAAEMPMEAEIAVTSEEADLSTTSADGAGGLDMEVVEDFTEKIIYTGYVNIETTAFDASLTALEQAVTEAGGFVQDSSVEGYSRTNSDGTTTVVDRWASYTVRIPADQFTAFMAMADGLGNVTSSSKNAQNVTSQYTDYEARLDTLYTQEERLLAMLEESGDLDSLIALEARLSDVRYEIESIERNLRNLDQKLAYSTVNLTLQEVEIYTPTVPINRTFGEKLSDAFADGWSGFVRGLQNLCFGLAAALPVLVLLVILAVLAIAVVRKVRRQRRARKNRPEPPKDGNNEA